jgi:hypothetical protein
MRWIFNARVIGCSLLVALVLLAATLGLLWYTRPGPAAAGPATAVLNIIPAPTDTSPAPTATAQQSPTPTSQVPPSPGPGMIANGGYVQIAGTQGDGLRLRTEPGLESQVRILGAESEVFQVEDGPVEKDGYTWWYLVGPYDESRRGWAVSNYLEVVQNP